MAQFKIAPAAVVALAAAGTAKTVLYVKTGSSLPARLKRWWVDFDGVDFTQKPILVEIMRYTTDCTVTSITPRSKNSILSALASVATAGSNCTSEGTAGDVVGGPYLVYPYGSKDVMLPLGDEIEIGKSERLGIRCTIPSGGAAVNVMPGFETDE